MPGEVTGREQGVAHCTGALPGEREIGSPVTMPDDAPVQEPDRPSHSSRALRRAVVFMVVLAVAVLLGRFGSGTDDGPAVEVDRSAPDAEIVRRAAGWPEQASASVSPAGARVPPRQTDTGEGRPMAQQDPVATTDYRQHTDAELVDAIATAEQQEPRIAREESAEALAAARRQREEMQEELERRGVT